MSVQVPAVGERQHCPIRHGRGGAIGLFYSGMAIAAAVVVFAGFAPTYFLKPAFGGPPLPPLLHVHGLIFTSWMVLFIVQARLIAGRRTPLHRRLGVAWRVSCGGDAGRRDDGGDRVGAPRLHAAGRTAAAHVPDHSAGRSRSSSEYWWYRALSPTVSAVSQTCDAAGDAEPSHAGDRAFSRHRGRSVRSCSGD